MTENFVTKDSGARAELAGGMVRDSETDKADYTLMLDGPMFERWSALLGRGAKKYKPRNWCLALASTDKAEREKTKDRFKRSALRHMMQWLRGDRDEDHAAAVFFNVNGYEAMLDTDWCPACIAREGTGCDELDRVQPRHPVGVRHHRDCRGRWRRTGPTPGVVAALADVERVPKVLAPGVSVRVLSDSDNRRKPGDEGVVVCEAEYNHSWYVRFADHAGGVYCFMPEELEVI